MIRVRELVDVVQEAARRNGTTAEARELGLLATCISVMRARGWTIKPPGGHEPIEPK
jgi:hypothetical protein